MKKETMDKLETLSDSAIDRFMDEMATAVYKWFSVSVEVVPFLASAAGIAANFCSITFALAIQNTDVPFDVEMGLSEVELNLFSTFAHVIPLLCPLSAPTMLPKPDQLQGDLVRPEEVLAPEGKEAEKEKAMTSTSSDGTLQASWMLTSFSRSRSAIPACSHESSPSPAKSQASKLGILSIDASLNAGQTRSRFLPKYTPPLQHGC